MQGLSLRTGNLRQLLVLVLSHELVKKLFVADLWLVNNAITHAVPQHVLLVLL